MTLYDITILAIEFLKEILNDYPPTLEIFLKDQDSCIKINRHNLYKIDEKTWQDSWSYQ